MTTAILLSLSIWIVITAIQEKRTLNKRAEFRRKKEEVERQSRKRL